MSILRKVQKVLTIAETSNRRLENSALWRVACKQLLREATLLETQWEQNEDSEAREGFEENNECQDQEATEFSTDLTGMLTAALGRPARDTLPSSKERTNVVSLPPSSRSRRT